MPRVRLPGASAFALFLLAAVAFASGVAGGPAATSAGLSSRPAGATSVAGPPVVDARAYAVVDQSCGGVLLWGENERERLAPASLTKIITALVVVDSVPLDATAPSDVSATKMRSEGSSVMGLEPGMRLSIRDLLYGMLLKSGNDAALVLAENSGFESVDGFVRAMNVKARELGMRDSHFANPHGLDAEGQHSSPLDMAKAGAQLLKNPVLAQMVATASYTPDWPGGALRNGNRLLGQYEGAYGVKIGYTTAAGQTIVAAAERDGRRIIVSLFGSADRYPATEALLDWAFDSTQSPCDQADAKPS
jgi:D-alanyl-D-alanine carboxypeptidase (penicillin-binding protein 5/6)